jgi:hypothetical protein
MIDSKIWKMRKSKIRETLDLTPAA